MIPRISPWKVTQSSSRAGEVLNRLFDMNKLFLSTHSRFKKSVILKQFPGESFQSYSLLSQSCTFCHPWPLKRKKFSTKCFCLSYVLFVLGSTSPCRQKTNVSKYAIKFKTANVTNGCNSYYTTVTIMNFFVYVSRLQRIYV